MSKEVRSLQRGLAALDALAKMRRPLTLAEVAGALELSKSTVHRLLTTLVQEGWVTQDPGGHYRLSLKIAQIGAAVTDGLSVVEVAHPVLSRLAQATGETVHLVMLDQTAAVYIAKIESRSPIRMYSRVGKQAPLHCTGVGKAILSQMPEEEVRSLVERTGLKGYTPRTITQIDLLLAHLREIRNRGYAIDDEEHEEGVCCVAAPVHYRDGRLFGALSISAVSYRMPLKQLLQWAPDVVGAAREISSLLDAGLG